MPPPPARTAPPVPTPSLRVALTACRPAWLCLGLPLAAACKAGFLTVWKTFKAGTSSGEIKVRDAHRFVRELHKRQDSVCRLCADGTGASQRRWAATRLHSWSRRRALGLIQVSGFADGGTESPRKSMTCPRRGRAVRCVQHRS